MSKAEGVIESFAALHDKSKKDHRKTLPQQCLCAKRTGTMK